MKQMDALFVAAVGACSAEKIEDQAGALFPRHASSNRAMLSGIVGNYGSG